MTLVVEQSADVPQAPGETSIPDGHVRLYHYTVAGDSDHDKTLAANALRTNGLDIKHARGGTYGEPNVVWASTQLPNHGKVFAEFSVAVDDPRWKVGRPQEGVSATDYQALNWDSYFDGSIGPHEIIAVHEPWHRRYRYLLDNPSLLQKARDGGLDYALEQPEFGTSILKVKGEIDA